MLDVELIVIHDTESANLPKFKDLAGVGAWFDNPISDASSHVCTDAEGNSARFVRDHDKAWSCRFYNPVSFNIEQIGFAQQGSWGEPELRETARWIAFWHHNWGIPILKGKVSVDGKIVRPGVIRHSELGRLGGNHSDPGSSYPLAHVNDVARFFAKKY